MSQNRSTKLGAQIFQLELTCFLKLCEAVNTPRGLACYMLASAGEWDQYLGLSMPDTEFPSFPDDYLVSEAMRKNPLLETSFDCRKAAESKWLEAEEDCAVTNALLTEYQEGRICFHPATETLLTKTQRIIADILGPLTANKLSICESSFRFGPGATSSCSGADVVPSRKMISSMDVTSLLLPYYRVLQPKGWTAYSQASYCEVAGNRVTFVPKTAKTDRAIAIEPHMNIYVQLGIGALLRQQLSKAGLDLDTGADENRRRAGLAWKTNEATIDLSSASDTIAFKLVELLLPVDWFMLLSLARSERSELNGAIVELNKFSSMGNGFTFELESLIFWAMARACSEITDTTPCVFGDDIICSRAAAQKLIPYLKTLGFKINEQKTYLAGTFFESCGADYHRGVNVRPLYFKGVYNDITAAVIRVANKIRLYAHRRGYSIYCDSRFRDVWLFASNSDTRAQRTGVPVGAGDDGLVKNFDEAVPAKAKYGYAGFFACVWRCTPARSARTVVRGAYLCALAWGTSDDTSRLFEPERGGRSHGKIHRQYVIHWRDLGPWI